MISARAHHTIRQLTGRRGRSMLTIITIAVAIAGVWMFAIPGNVRGVLADRVETDAMHTARLAPNAAPLDAGQLARLRAVDNVAALDTRTLARDDIASTAASRVRSLSASTRSTSRPSTSSRSRRATSPSAPANS